MRLKKKIREKRDRAHGSVTNWLRPKFAAFGARHRLATRIRLANIKATAHPKKTFCIMVGTLLSIIACDFVISAMCYDYPLSTQVEIANVDTIFNGFRKIQANKEATVLTVREIAIKGQQLRSEIDSLAHLPVKTHSDSISILTKYNQLQNIVTTLRTEQ